MPGQSAGEMVSALQQRWSVNDRCQAIFAEELKRLDPVLHSLFMANPRFHEGSGNLLGYEGQAKINQYNIKALEFERSRKIPDKSQKNN